MTLKFTAGENDAGRKIYTVLKTEMKLSSALIRRLKNAKGIFLNGAPAYTTARISAGDVISADLALAERESAVKPENGEINILYENEGFIIVNKPSGVIVHPSRARADGSLASVAAGYLERTGQEGAVHIVTRLDRDTSGAVVIAKSAHYKTLLTQAFHSEDAVKRYIAINYGAFPEKRGVIDAPVARVEEKSMRRAVICGGQRAVTLYEVLREQADYSVMSFVLKTGRTHQIRVHSSFTGNPVLGDKLYGNELSNALSERMGITSQALHAEMLRFTEPVSGERLEIHAPVIRPGEDNTVGILSAALHDSTENYFTAE